MLMVLSFPSAKNPMKRLSGDQNGFNGVPLSVPGSGWATAESSERTHSDLEFVVWLRLVYDPPAIGRYREKPGIRCAKRSGHVDIEPDRPRLRLGRLEVAAREGR